ncbi:MAG TPA: putative peptidoglycan glycosyltransferase FtsW [Rhodothermales bacterium]
MPKAKPHSAKAMTLRMPSDRFIIWAVAGLAAVGIVAVYSAITYLAATKAGSAPESFLLRHVVRTFIALAAVVIFSRIDYHKLAAISKGALILSIVLLIGVQIVGVTIGGAERWYRVWGISIQPSDFARVALLLHVALLLARKQLYVEDLHRSFLPLTLWVIPTLGLIAKEDLSTGVMVFATFLVMAYVARVRVAHLGSLTAVLAVCAVIFLLLSPERANRITSWIGVGQTSEATDVQGEGYQAHQAKIAFAMGGLAGVGPGKSVQRDFLPAPYNDFIFAIVAEEYGIIGATLLLAIFCVLLFRGFIRVARSAPDPLGFFLAVGVTTMICLYGLVNAAVACGLFPVTGLPMPFVSYGGTSLLASGVLIGILLNISKSAAMVAPVSSK